MLKNSRRNSRQKHERRVKSGPFSYPETSIRSCAVSGYSETNRKVDNNTLSANTTNDASLEYRLGLVREKCFSQTHTKIGQKRLERRAWGTNRRPLGAFTDHPESTLSLLTSYGNVCGSVWSDSSGNRSFAVFLRTRSDISKTPRNDKIDIRQEPDRFVIPYQTYTAVPFQDAT